MKLIDLTGQIFGRLTVLGRAENYISPKGYKIVKWYCKCNCGNPEIIEVMGKSLNRGKTKSCGCLQRETVIKNDIASKKYNRYDLTGSYGIGYTFKDEPFWFDLEDYDKIKDYCWRYNIEGYIVSSMTNSSSLLHRLIMNPTKFEMVDHIYHYKYDNRKSQMRIVSNSQNMMNENIPKNNTSGVKGVRFNYQSSLWNAYIGFGKNVILKSFNNKEDAITCRKLLEEKYHGDYALKREQQLNNNMEVDVVE